MLEETFPDDCQFMNEQIAVSDPYEGRHLELFWILHRVSSHVLVSEKDMPVVLRTKKACLDLDEPLLSPVGSSDLGNAQLLQPSIVEAVRTAQVEILGVCRERKQMRGHEMFYGLKVTFIGAIVPAAV